MTDADSYLLQIMQTHLFNRQHVFSSTERLRSLLDRSMKISLSDALKCSRSENSRLVRVVDAAGSDDVGRLTLRTIWWYSQSGSLQQ